MGHKEYLEECLKTFREDDLASQMDHCKYAIIEEIGEISGWYKKHFGYIYALQKALPFAILNFLKFIYFFIIRDGKKSEIYKLFFLGFVNSLFNRKSIYRAEID